MLNDKGMRRALRSDQRALIGKFKRILPLLVACQLLPGVAGAQDLNAQASNLCGVAAGTLITGQYQAQQVFAQEALQVLLQQTGGSGRYQQLQPYGPPSGQFITNPHYDQDPTQGQLFHFYCNTQHQVGMLQWELKYSVALNRLVYYTFAPAQQQAPQQPAFPTNQPSANFPQTPGNNPQVPANPQWPTNNPQMPTNNPQMPTNNPQMPTNNPQLPTNNPQVPTNNPQVPTNNPQAPNPQTPGSQQPAPAPSREEACKMFPGMC